MTTSTSSGTPPTANAIPNDELEQLRDALKRCPPETFAAACEFRRTGNVACLDPVILGVLQRYVERELRSKLHEPSDDLRLVEDLGLDSLTMMEIILLVEDVLKVSITNEELCQLRTLGAIRHFVAAKAGPSPASG